MIFIETGRALKRWAWSFLPVGERATQLEEFDATVRRSSEVWLREVWGTDYDRNLARIHSLLDQCPEGLKPLLLGARLSNGCPLGSHVDALQWLLSMSRA